MGFMYSTRPPGHVIMPGRKGPGREGGPLRPEKWHRLAYGSDACRLKLLQGTLALPGSEKFMRSRMGM